MVGNYIRTVIHECDVQVRILLLTIILQYKFVQTVEFPHDPTDTVSGYRLFISAGGNNKNNTNVFLGRLCLDPINSEWKLTY
ncbi:MAG: hypothetical protein RLZZ370_341 [Bacteroidota bacterium]